MIQRYLVTCAEYENDSNVKTYGVMEHSKPEAHKIASEYIEEKKHFNSTAPGYYISSKVSDTPAGHEINTEIIK